MTIQELLQEVDHLPATDKWRLVKHVLDTREQLRTPPPSDYHAFLRESYGARRDAPIQRWPQGDYEKREPLEPLDSSGLSA